MPKYDPPYLKRPLVNAPMAAKPGVSGANHNNANPAMPMSMSTTDPMSLEAGAKGISFGNMTAYGYMSNLTCLT